MRPSILRRPTPWVALVAVLALIAPGMACKVGSPTSPTPSTQLTGQTDNEDATFDGTITIFGGGAAVADGENDILIAVEVRDRAGNPAQNFTPVLFSTDLGTVRASGADPATAGSTARVTTFAGQASVLLRSAAPGTATVVANIANVSAATTVVFESGPPTDVITLVFRSGGADVASLTGTAPLLTDVVAKVVDEDGLAIPGRTVRFRIAEDSAGAALTGDPRTRTDSSGEAFNVLQVDSAGTVSLVAELLDGQGGVVAESNHIIATVTAQGSNVQLTLTWTAGGTVTSVTVPDTAGMALEVRDAETGEALPGRRVSFIIIRDTAVADSAELAFDDNTLTNGSGVATNAVTVREADTVVVVEAQLVDPNGFFIAASNQIVLEAEAPEEDDGS